jgi:hypothetical protein
MAIPYIPPKDADFNDWLVNFSTLLTANPTNYGLVAGDATAVATVKNAWVTAYTAAVNPTTRTSATIATKDGARASAEATVRPYAIRIRNNSSVSDALKIGIGVTIPDTPPTPIPAPSTSPLPGFISAIPLETTLAYKDSGTLGKGKPFGAIGVEVWRSIGVAYATDPVQCTYTATVTKTPFKTVFIADDQGKKCTIFLRFVTRSGPGGAAQWGPWSTPLNFIII